MKASVPTTAPPGEGWQHWGRVAYGYVEVEIWRYGWRETKTIDPRQMHPGINIHGLHWRPAGDRLTGEAMMQWALYGR